MSARDPVKTALDVAALRRDFPVLDLRVNDKPLIFLDNAASSQMPRPVIERWVKYRSSHDLKYSFIILHS